jgi:hypothetical protein
MVRGISLLHIRQCLQRLASLKTAKGSTMPTPIAGPGSYSKSNIEYYLANDIPGSLAFTGENVKLNLNGKTVQGTTSGNVHSVGISSTSLFGYFVVFGGKVTGHRVGVDIRGLAQLENVDLSGNRYIGANLRGAGSLVRCCECADIGGVSDEAYAIGINISGNNTTVKYSTFRNLYRQVAADPSIVGEGCPIVFNTACSGGRAENVIMINDEAREKTIGIFAGRGGHVIDKCVSRNFERGYHLSATNTLRDSEAWMMSRLPTSIGVYAGDGLAERNLIANYATGFEGTITQVDNRVC